MLKQSEMTKKEKKDHLFQFNHPKLKAIDFSPIKAFNFMKRKLCFVFLSFSILLKVLSLTQLFILFFKLFTIQFD